MREYDRRIRDQAGFRDEYLGHIPRPHPLMQEKERLKQLIDKYPDNPLLKIKLSLLDVKIAYGLHHGMPPRRWLENLVYASVPERELLISLVEKLTDRIWELKNPPPRIPWWQELWNRIVEGLE